MRHPCRMLFLYYSLATWIDAKSHDNGLKLTFAKVLKKGPEQVTVRGCMLEQKLPDRKRSAKTRHHTKQASSNEPGSELLYVLFAVRITQRSTSTPRITVQPQLTYPDRWRHHPTLSNSWFSTQVLRHQISTYHFKLIGARQLKRCC